MLAEMLSRFVCNAIFSRDNSFVFWAAGLPAKRRNGCLLGNFLWSLISNAWRLHNPAAASVIVIIIIIIEQ
jgi:hypothetical protein